MPRNEALNKLSKKLKISVAAARAATKTKKQKTDSQEALAVQKVLDAVNIPEQIRAGKEHVLVMQIGEANVTSALFSGGPASENFLERAQRVADELRSCTAEHLTGTAALVFKTCKDAGLNVAIETRLEYETQVPYIIAYL